MVFETLFKDAKQRVVVSTSDDNQRNEEQSTSNSFSASSKKKKTRPPKQNHNKSHKAGPSAEAIELSSKLKEYSTQKRLEDCLQLFWDKENDNIRDEHHACIVVDCCARCGDITKGEEVIQFMKNHHMTVNVQTNTSLLKGYCHSGLLHKASRLYQTMSRNKQLKERPNVRTLNTLLRGCLWTAAQVQNGLVEGGVATSEKIWPTQQTNILTDISSYEYSIALLIQSFHLEQAEQRVRELCEKFSIRCQQVKDGYRYTVEQDAFSCLESLAVCFLNLGKTYALMGEDDRAKTYGEKTLNVISGAKSAHTKQLSSQTTAMGGKRSFREMNAIGGISRREESNSIFRAHKLRELENDAKVVLSYIEKGGSNKRTSLASILVRKIIATDGGGTTDMAALKGSKDRSFSKLSRDVLCCKLLNSLWVSFGLSMAIKKEFPRESFPDSLGILSQMDCENILKLLQITQSYILNDDGTIDFQKVFLQNADEKPHRPLCLELGSGFGEWAAFQAHSNPNNDYVAVEMRSDRVSQTFCKAYLTDNQHPLRNLCCVGSECGSFLRNHIQGGSVSKIFVNHPEPPTQTYGTNTQVLHNIASGGAEPAHMLASETILSAARCLDKTSGELVIVTDNRWYANLICSTVVKAMTIENGILYSKSIKGLRRIDVFRGTNGQQVDLYEGQPGPNIGHAAAQSQSGSTYFDRLWRKGGGSHADTKARFIICLQRCFTGNDEMGQNRNLTNCQISNSKKNKNKRSLEKQQRRNERRLQKKSRIDM